jgi:hypothetical protein
MIKNHLKSAADLIAEHQICVKMGNVQHIIDIINHPLPQTLGGSLVIADLNNISKLVIFYTTPEPQGYPEVSSYTDMQDSYVENFDENIIQPNCKFLYY